MKYLYTIIVLLLTGLVAKAQISAPKYSNEFLSIGVGARANAMGNAQVATAADVTSGYWNPAGLVQTQSRFEGSLMHAEYFGGIANYDYAGISARLDTNSSLAISYIRLGIDGIPDTRYLIENDVIDYSKVRSFSSSDNAFLVSYAHKNLFVNGLNAGLNFKIIYRNAGTFANAWGFGLDAGAQYRRKNLLLGVMARDVTSTFNAWSFNTSQLATVYTQTGNAIPQNSIELTLPKWIVGIGYNIQVWKIGILPVLDADLSFDGKRNTVVSTSVVSLDPKAGLEVNYNNIVFARAGVQNIQKIKKLDESGTSTVMQPSFGVGVKIKRFRLDYALTNMGDQETSNYSNIFSLVLGI